MNLSVSVDARDLVGRLRSIATKPFGDKPKLQTEVLTQLLRYPAPTVNQLERSVDARQLIQTVSRLGEGKGQDKGVTKLCQQVLASWDVTAAGSAGRAAHQQNKNFLRECAAVHPVLLECLNTSRPSKVTAAVKAIASLSKSKPTREQLQEILPIIRTVKRLRVHETKNLSQSAKGIYSQWKLISNPTTEGTKAQASRK